MVNGGTMWPHLFGVRVSKVAGLAHGIRHRLRFYPLPTSMCWRLENPTQTSHPCRDAAAIHQRFSVQRRDIVLEVEVFADLLHDRIMDRALDVDLLRLVGVFVGAVPAVFDAVLDGF
jgi:hypothetical protein